MLLVSLLKKILNSIALVPSVLALCFLFLAVILLVSHVNYSAYDTLRFFVIDDKESTQSIFSFIIGGIFTLTIFSYTMVMNVLNRNITAYSPRLIPMLLSEKDHQIILGFSSGTIIYCLVLSIGLNNTSDAYFPGIAAALGIIFTIVCVFLFIYFIHSVSQSIHINYILNDVYKRTKKSLEQQSISLANYNEVRINGSLKYPLILNKIGHLHKFDIKRLRDLCAKKGFCIQVDKVPGTFIQLGDHLLTSDIELDDHTRKKLKRIFTIDNEVPLKVPEIGFKHLVEVAVKASSPGINDPGTSKTCIDYLTQLFILRMNGHPILSWMADEQNNLILRGIEDQPLLTHCYMEMFQYMKDDHILPVILANSLRTIKNNVKKEIDINIGGIPVEENEY